jgi:hypothetical protein
VKAGDTLFIYYSTVFEDFAEIREKYAHRGQLVNMYQTEYEVWTALHAVTQYLAGTPEEHSLDVETMEKISEGERTRFGKVQAKQALRSANLKLAAEKAVRTAGAD